jgi:hypothetical protein
MAILKHGAKRGLIGIVLLWSLGGCGYRIEGRGASLPADVQSIAIPTMANDTLEAGIENAFTRAMIREFNLDGRLTVAKEERADSVLEGTIQDFTISSISSDRAGLVLEYRAQVTLDLTYRRVNTGEILWEALSIQEIEEYRADSDALANEARKQEAIEEIAREVAETTHDLIVEGF